MGILQDFFSLLAGSIALAAINSRPQSGVTLVIGILLAVLCWFGCSWYSRLWNRRYRLTFTHHVLCALAGGLTLAFTVFFAALYHARTAAEVSVKAWEDQINLDATWGDATFASAWQKVKALGREDFSNVLEPGMDGSSIPTSHIESVRLAADTYAKASVEHFKKNRPFLSLILQAHSELPLRVLEADVNSYFAKEEKSYPRQKAISLVASQITGQLSDQLSRVVPLVRAIAVCLFVGVPFTLFGLVGLSAYRALKVVT